MTRQHPTAVVDPAAKVGSNVEIGPFCVIGPNVKLGDNCRLHSHVVVEGDTTIGPDCEIFPFASIGHTPQDLKFGGEKSRLEIGDHNIIREYVTINPGTRNGNLLTKVGSHCMFMAHVHIAHDCSIGDHVIMANAATLGGHCKIGDFVIIGGLSACHQFVRVGDHAFVGGMSGVENDVIPFGMIVGTRASLKGLNLIGMKRRGLTRTQLKNLRQAYDVLFGGNGTLLERVDKVAQMFPDEDYVDRVLDFIRADSTRSFSVPKDSPA